MKCDGDDDSSGDESSTTTLGEERSVALLPPPVNVSVSVSRPPSGNGGGGGGRNNATTISAPISAGEGDVNNTGETISMMATTVNNNPEHVVAVAPAPAPNIHMNHTSTPPPKVKKISTDSAQQKSPMDSPATQTLNELSAMDTKGDDLMYDMSQLSQLPLYHQQEQESKSTPSTSLPSEPPLHAPLSDQFQTMDGSQSDDNDNADSKERRDHQGKKIRCQLNYKGYCVLLGYFHSESELNKRRQMARDKIDEWEKMRGLVSENGERIGEEGKSVKRKLDSQWIREELFKLNIRTAAVRRPPTLVSPPSEKARSETEVIGKIEGEGENSGNGNGTGVGICIDPTKYKKNEFTFHFVLLKDRGSFGMLVKKANQDPWYTYVSEMMKDGQALQSGIQVEDRIFKPPPEWRDRLKIEGKISDDDLVDICGLQPLSVREIVNVSKSNIRPVELVLQRQVKRGRQACGDNGQEGEVKIEEEVKVNVKTTAVDTEKAVAPIVQDGTKRTIKSDESQHKEGGGEEMRGSLSCKIIQKALLGKGYPQIPCCRKCKDPSFRSHHYLCPKHRDFRNSGSKEKLIMLFGGAYVGCEACIAEIETGRKNTKIAHSEECKVVPFGDVSSHARRKAGTKEKGTGSTKSHDSAKTDSPTNKKKIGKNKGQGGKQGKTLTVKKKGTDGTKTPDSTKTESPTSKKKMGSNKGRTSITKRPSRHSRLLRKDENGGSRKSPLGNKKSSLDCNERIEIGPHAAGYSEQSEEKGENGNIPKSKNSVENKGRGTKRKEAVSLGTLELSKKKSNRQSCVRTTAIFSPSTLKGVTKKKGPLNLTDDNSVPKWVPCHNPWGDKGHCEGDFVLFSSSDYRVAFHLNGAKPKRFVWEPFAKESSYCKTHMTPQEGVRVLELTRDRLGLRAWGFDFCLHDFGGACLVTEVEPLSPADAAVDVGGSRSDAPALQVNDLILCINGKKVSGMTVLDLEVELEVSHSQIILVVAKYRASVCEPVSAYARIGLEQTLHWTEVGKEPSQHRDGNFQLDTSLSSVDHAQSMVAIDTHVVDEINTPHKAHDCDDNSSMTSTCTLPGGSSGLHTQKAWNKNKISPNNADDGIMINNSDDCDSQSQNSSSQIISNDVLHNEVAQDMKVENPTNVSNRNGSDAHSLDQILERRDERNATAQCEIKPPKKTEKKRQQNKQRNGAGSEEEEEWEDDENPWLGCICGTTHESPTPVFWIQCDSCDAWFNVAPVCIGFDKEEASNKSDWECPNCAPSEVDVHFDEIETAKEPADYPEDQSPTTEPSCSDTAENELMTPDKQMFSYTEVTKKQIQPFPVGSVVYVTPRMGRGSNKPGGTAKVTDYRITDDDVLYDVQYVLDRNREKKVESMYVSLYENAPEARGDITSPKITTRSASLKNYL